MRQPHGQFHKSRVVTAVGVSGQIIMTALVLLTAGGFVSIAQNVNLATWEQNEGPSVNDQHGSLSPSPLDRDDDGSSADARECMRRIQEEARASTEIIEVVMTLTEPSGRTRKRRATFYQKLKSTTCMARLIRFHSPPEIAGAAVLSLENADREDDWWIYVPAYHVTRRIPSKSKSETFMGTDLTYEDLTDLRLGHYSFRFAEADTIEGMACRLLEASPLESDTKSYSQYGKLVYWVEVSRPLYPKALFYGHDGAVIKEVRNSDAVQVDGKWRWNRTEMSTLQIDHRTVVDVQDRRIGEPIPDRVFTERALRRSG